MAQVPYDPVPTGAPGPLPTEGPRVDAPGAAFGTNIGEAIQRGGAQVGQAGNELFQTALQIQDLKNETDARNQSIAITQAMAKRYSEFDSLEGTARTNAMPALLKDLDNLRLQGRAGLNPRAARYYDQEVANLQNSFTRYAALQAGRGITEEYNKNFQAKIDLESKSSIGPADIPQIQAKWNRIDAALKERMEPTKGNWTKAMYEDAALKAKNNLWASQIDLTRETNLQQAWKLYNTAAAAGELTDETQKGLQSRLFQQSNQDDSRYIAKQVYRPDKPMEQAVDEGRRMAKDYAHGNEALEGHVEAAIKGKYVYDDAIIRRQNNEDKNTIQQAMAKAASGNQLVDTAQLRMDPNVDAAVKRLQYSDPAYVNGLDNTIQKFYDYKHRQENDYNFGLFKQWELSDPPRFMKENVNNYPMSDKQRDAVISAKERIAKDPNGDPRVTDAIKYLQDRRKGDMMAVGIFTQPKPGEPYNPAWGRFVSALEGGIQAYTQKHKGEAPGYEDIVDVIGPQAIARAGVAYYVPGTSIQYWTSTPGEVPQETLDAARKEHEKKHPGSQPTDDELRIGAYRDQFLEFYSKGQTGGGPTSTKPGGA